MRSVKTDSSASSAERATLVLIDSVSGAKLASALIVRLALLADALNARKVSSLATDNAKSAALLSIARTNSAMNLDALSVKMDTISMKASANHALNQSQAVLCAHQQISASLVSVIICTLTKAFANAEKKVEISIQISLPELVSVRMDTI